MNPNYDKLIAVLREIFQLNQADLDFGIYRILNQRRTEITDFLENRLVPQVKAIIGSSNLGDSAKIKAELDEIIAGLKKGKLSDDIINANEEVQRLQHELKAAPSPESLENEIFSHLASFFRRYYKDGDFISMRRYKKDVYAIPYEGEEVKLHWANHDQYYIKTSEYLKNYGFRLKPSGRTVRFELAEASTEKDNRKEESGKERRFRIFADKPLEVQGDSLTVFFAYEPTDKKEKQEDLNAAAADAIKPLLPADWVRELLEAKPTDKDKTRTLLDKHIRDFTARNTFDYFIHKDLGGFLTRELDFYIKNEVLHLDDLNFDSTADFQKQLLKVQALQAIGSKIIAFLAQLENFQKKLWLKKKFVVDAQYCITLDRIPAEFYPEIAANDAQRQEWVRLFAIDELIAPGKEGAQSGLFDGEFVPYTVPLTVDFLKTQPYLVLDTAFFPETFKHRLLASFDDLDEQLDGLLINSENFQALNLLQERYENQIESVFIDPPYNTGEDGFIYKDNYQHSAWICMLENRLRVSRTLLSNTGFLGSVIDYVEVSNLRLILDTVFGSENFLADIAWEKRYTRSNNAKKFYSLKDTILCYSSTEDLKTIKEGRTDKSKENYQNPDNDDRGPWISSSYVNPATKSKRQNLVYKIINPFTNVEVEHPTHAWKYDTITHEDHIKEKRLYWGLDGGYEFPRLKSFLSEASEGMVPVDVWSYKDAGTNDDGGATLKDLFGIPAFSNPKPTQLVEKFFKLRTKEGIPNLLMDYFAGSGTTAHAVINLNREDGGRRKYILVEMGQYFDTVTKPRIQKVVHSADWKDGKPVGRKGSSHAFKYLRLESYEDTLNNLSLSRQPQQQQLLDLNERFHEEYLLHYWLDVESEGSLLSTAAFERPFDYQLNITQHNETLPTRIDLVETFNYLTGLKVKTTERIRGLHVVTGETLNGQQVLVIWRNLTGEGAVSNAALDEFFRKQGYSTRDRDFDRIYVNGDNNLENLKAGDEVWKVGLIEEVFFGGMFGQDV